jgi:hypothetical protein
MTDPLHLARNTPGVSAQREGGEPPDPHGREAVLKRCRAQRGR